MPCHRLSHRKKTKAMQISNNEKSKVVGAKQSLAPLLLARPFCTWAKVRVGHLQHLKVHGKNSSRRQDAWLDTKSCRWFNSLSLKNEGTLYQARVVKSKANSRAPASAGDSCSDYCLNTSSVRLGIFLLGQTWLSEYLWTKMARKITN